VRSNESDRKQQAHKVHGSGRLSENDDLNKRTVPLIQELCELLNANHSMIPLWLIVHKRPELADETVGMIMALLIIIFQPVHKAR
jgi:hypothetical protein